eukprot:350136-Chlamydomonas_euryale.AAC.28
MRCGALPASEAPGMEGGGGITRRRVASRCSNSPRASCAPRRTRASSCERRSWVRHSRKGCSCVGLGRSLFDCGCGRIGDHNRWLSMNAIRVVGIDASVTNLSDPDPRVSSAYIRLLKFFLESIQSRDGSDRGGSALSRLWIDSRKNFKGRM